MLRFVLDDLRDFAGVHWGKFDEFGEDVETGGADIDVLGFDALLDQHPLQSLEDSGFAGVFLGAFGPQRFDPELLQAQTARFVDFKLGQLETARPKINRQK